MSNCPKTLQDALVSLRDYCNDYFRERLSGESLPVEFWQIDDDDLYIEVLGFMPLFVMPEVIAEEGIPGGFLTAYPVFMLEDGYITEGYTAFANAGPEVIAWAIDCYRTIGLPEEAEALEAARAAMLAEPNNEDAWIEAYESTPNPYHDDDLRYETIAKWFCENRAIFEGD